MDFLTSKGVVLLLFLRQENDRTDPSYHVILDWNMVNEVVDVYSAG